MATYSIKQLLSGNVATDTTISIRGWVRTRRDSKAGFSFINVYDGSCFDGIQVVANKDLANYENEVLQCTTGASVEITGTLVESQGKGQSVEVQASAVTLVGEVIDPESYPVAKKRHSFEFLRTVAHLRPRTNTFGAVTRVRNSVSQAIHRYFHEHGFFWINTPIITASDCEGAGELFRVSTLDMVNPPKVDGQIDYSQDFFGNESFLTVSGQLNAETYACALSKVYTFGPTFRAENSNTTRHLAEFWMVEPEVAFANLQDNADLAQDFLKYIFAAVLRECPDDMDFFAQRIEPTAISRLEGLVQSNFVQMTYTEAVDILTQCKQDFEFPVTWGIDLQSEHERFLAEQHCKAPVIVTDYPKDIKAFYMRLNDDEKTVAAMDVLCPGVGEIIGGSQREERLNVLEQRMNAHGLEGELEWYKDLRRFGTVPHAGFGMGFERVVSYITGMENVRDVTPFPRVPNNASF